MSVESYDSSGVIEQILEIQTTEVIHRAVAEKILDDANAQKITRDFMWNYVGHPDKQRRLAGEQPGLYRLDNHYTREVYTGFSQHGDLIHVRAIPGMLTEAQGYVVALGNIQSGVLEPVVHKSSTVGGIDPRDTRLQLLDRAAMDNAPWGHCPSQYAPAYDQHMLYVRVADTGEHNVTYRKGRDGEVAFHPIEELYASMDFIENERTLLARSAFMLITSDNEQ